MYLSLDKLWNVFFIVRMTCCLFIGKTVKIAHYDIVNVTVYAGD